MWCSKNANAQIAISAGGNFCSVREDIGLKNVKWNDGYFFGFSVQYYPFKKLEKLSLINEINYSQKGYRQDLDKEYSFRFNYVTFPVLANYSVHPNVSVQGGIELASLFSTNVEGGMSTYNHFDFGLVGGITCFDSKRIGAFARLSYGLLSDLEYHKIDEMGNFDGKIKDVKNICFTIGLKFKLHNEKIPSRK